MGYFKNNFYGQRTTRARPVSFASPPPAAYENVKQQNAIVLQWVPKVRTKLKSSARWFSDGKTEPFVKRGLRTEKKLAASIASKTKKSFGEIEVITFSFERHGVFVHKGVGRGYEANEGFVTRTAKGPQLRPRVAVEWFNPVLDENIPELADRLAEINGDAALNTARVRIK